MERGESMGVGGTKRDSVFCMNARGNVFARIPSPITCIVMAALPEYHHDNAHEGTGEKGEEGKERSSLGISC